MEPIIREIQVKSIFTKSNLRSAITRSTPMWDAPMPANTAMPAL